MTDSISRVREIVRALGLSIPEERLEKLAAGYDQAIAETEAVRTTPTPTPTPAPFDAAWSAKK